MPYSTFRRRPLSRFLLAIPALILLLWYIAFPHPGVTNFLSGKSSGQQHANLGIAIRADEAKNDAVPGWLSSHQDRSAAVEKGKLLKCLMEKPADGDGPQSTWTDTAALQKYGWKTTRSSRFNEIGSLGLSTAFEDLQISPLPEDWSNVNAVHSLETEVDGKKYPATMAIYTTLLNLKDGVMMATYSYSPRYQIEFDDRDVPPDQIVPVERWSDVSHLTRKGALDAALAASKDVDGKNFQHVFKHNIVGPGVKELLKEITGKDVGEVGEWPGMSYPIEEDQALAILSCPNALGVARLLGEHKAELGVKTVDLIRVFSCPETNRRGRKNHRWCLYMHVKDISEETAGP